MERLFIVWAEPERSMSTSAWLLPQTSTWTRQFAEELFEKIFTFDLGSCTYASHHFATGQRISLPLPKSYSANPGRELASIKRPSTHYVPTVGRATYENLKTQSWH